MSIHLAIPWAPTSRAYCLPGSVVLKLALGEAPETIPVYADVSQNRLPAASSLGIGVIDRIVAHHAGPVRVSRLHASANNLSRPGARHLGFNDREQLFGLARTFRIDVPSGTAIGRLVDSLNQINTVESAAPNYVCVTPFEFNGPQVADVDWSPWQLIRAADALAYEPGDPAVIIGLVDTGVAPHHAELDGRLRAGLDTVHLGQPEMPQGLQLVGDRVGIDIQPIDRYVGHGMGCAGIIGALGLRMPPGLAGETQIVPMRGLGAARFPGKTQAVGIGAISDLDMAVKLAVDLGAKIINMSFGTDDAVLDPRLPKPHTDVVDYAVDHGCVLVAASGNNGQETRYWPAAFPGVIAVGAVDGAGRPCAFSTRGSHVALCAPGERIFTLGLEAYQYATGTSFAAPFVCAAAALLVARAERRSTPLNGEIARRLLVDSAGRFGGPAPTGCGSGVLDVYAALQALDALIDRSLPDNPGIVEDG